MLKVSSVLLELNSGIFLEQAKKKYLFHSNKTEINTLSVEVVDINALRAHKKGLEIITFHSKDMPNQVRGDSGRVRQILIK